MVGKNSQDFLDSLDEDHVMVHLSPVVLAEVTRQTREAAEEASRALTRAIEDFRRSYPDLDVAPLRSAADALTAEAQADDGQPLAPLLANRACEVASYPAVTAEALVERELLRKRPSMVSGKATYGLRDQVIWEGCRELLRSNPEDHVVIVTQDKGFIDGDALHPDLLDDLADNARITVVPTLAEATVKANQYRNVYDERQAALTLLVLNYIEHLRGMAWDETVGDIDYALEPEQMRDSHVTDISSTVQEYREGNPATLELWVNVTLEGEVAQHLADPDDEAPSGEIDYLFDPNGDVRLQFRTSAIVKARVSYSSGAEGLETASPVIEEISFEWFW